MGKKRNHTPTDRPLPVIEPGPLAPAKRRSFGRWRATTLIFVYVLFAAHIIHWRITGRSLAPLELNEVMYTLELGIVTAGFLFMCLLVLGTAVFGRFFCSWACHIMAPQDLCAWLLAKLGIKAKPIRSRVLLWVPPLTACYMFVWPQIVRTAREGALPTFHIATDQAGWASFMTEHFWRNLPTPGVIALTFAVCGFLIIYLLGSRTFCTYVCPYGAVFSLADRLAPGRVRVTDACQQCGTCTAVCSSGVRVHEEVNRHGTIVNPACMKDLDCVAACPQGALYYGWGRPSLLKSRQSGGRFGLPYDFTVGEDLVMGGVFVAVTLSLRGLYGRVPFLLALACGAIVACLTVFAIRLAHRPNVTLAKTRLKQLGRVTIAGWAYVALMLCVTAFLGHSGFVRYHEYAGLRAASGLEDHPHDPGAFSLIAHQALRHLDVARADGLFNNSRAQAARLDLTSALNDSAGAIRIASEILDVDRTDRRALWQRAHAYRATGRADEAETDLRSLVALFDADGSAPNPDAADANRALAELLIARGDASSAIEALQRAVRFAPDRATGQAALGSALAGAGRWDDAVDHLRRAVEIDPTLRRGHYDLGAILVRMGRNDEAIAEYEGALKRFPDDPGLHNNLAHVLLRTGDLERAGRHANRALALDPNFAAAHFNLAAILIRQGRSDLAEDHAKTAARLDSRYARFSAAP